VSPEDVAAADTAEAEGGASEGSVAEVKKSANIDACATSNGGGGGEGRSLVPCDRRVAVALLETVTLFDKSENDGTGATYKDDGASVESASGALAS
jgi:hypothetical protein